MARIAGVWALLGALALVGCQRIQQTVRGFLKEQVTVTCAAPHVGGSPDGLRARVAVLGFEQKSALGSAEIGQGMADMLTTELMGANRFVVVERQKLGGVLSEQDLARAGRVREGTGAPTGQLQGADLLVTGAVTEFEPDYQGGALLAILFAVANGAASAKGYNVELNYRQSYVALDLRLIDSATSRVVVAAKVEARVPHLGVAVGGAGAGRHGALGGGFSLFRNAPMERAVRLCLAQAVATLVETTPTTYCRYNESGQPASPTQFAQPVRPAAVQPPPAPPAPAPPVAAGPASVEPAPAEPASAHPGPAGPAGPAPGEPEPARATPPQLSPSASQAEVYVAFGSVSVYESPDPNSRVVATTVKGMALRVHNEEGPRYFVATPDGITGWVLKVFTSASRE